MGRLNLNAKRQFSTIFEFFILNIKISHFWKKKFEYNSKHLEFCIIAYNRIWDRIIRRIFGKGIETPLTELYILKLHIFLIIYMYSILFFAQFHKLKTEISLSQKFWKKCDDSATCWVIFNNGWYTSIYVRLRLNKNIHEIL